MWWSHSNSSVGSDVCARAEPMPGGIRLFFSLLTRRCCCEWKPGEAQGHCVKKNNQAVTHEHLSVSQFLIEQASHTTQTHTDTHSLRLCGPCFVSFSILSFVSLPHPLISPLLSFLTRICCYTSLDLKRICCVIISLDERDNMSSLSSRNLSKKGP